MVFRLFVYSGFLVLGSSFLFVHFMPFKQSCVISTSSPFAPSSLCPQVHPPFIARSQPNHSSCLTLHCTIPAWYSFSHFLLCPSFLLSSLFVVLSLSHDAIPTFIPLDTRTKEKVRNIGRFSFLPLDLESIRDCIHLCLVATGTTTKRTTEKGLRKERS